MQFFSIFIPVMLGYGFSLIREKKLTKKERWTMIYFSAATPLFDDFFDDKNLDVNHLETIFVERENYQPQNSKEKLFFEILLSIKPKIHQPEKFINLCFNIFIAQKTALKQTSKEKLNDPELKKISFAKCSQSAILFWSLLNEDSTEAEKDLVLQVGNLIQYTDDIFDLWFDLKDGTQTLATNATSFIQLENDFNMELENLKSALERLPVVDFYKEKFWKWQWFFFSRTFVETKKLIELEHTNQDINLENFSRQQLVCDMEKWSNIWRWAQNFNLKPLDR